MPGITYNLQASFYDEEGLKASQEYATQLIAMNVGDVGQTDCVLNEEERTKVGKMDVKVWYGVFVNVVSPKYVERVLSLMEACGATSVSYAKINARNDEIKREWDVDVGAVRASLLETEMELNAVTLRSAFIDDLHKCNELKKRLEMLGVGQVVATHDPFSHSNSMLYQVFINYVQIGKDVNKVLDVIEELDIQNVSMWGENEDDDVLAVELSVLRMHLLNLTTHA